MGVKKIDVDSVWMDLGRYGRYQMWHYVLLNLPVAFTSWQMMVMTFEIAVPPHKCQFLHSNHTSQPYTSNECSIFVNTTTGEPKTIPCGENGTHITFDKEFGSTIVSEWTLTCSSSKQVLADTSGAVYMIGLLVGSLILTSLADKFGRKWVVVSAMFTVIPAGIGTGYVQTYAAYAVLRFLVGFAVSGITSVTFSFSAEVFAADRRSYVGIAPSVMWVVPYVLLGVAANYVRDWRTLRSIIDWPMICMVAYPFLIRESLAWLSASGQLERAKAEIAFAARVNRVKKNIDPESYVIEDPDEAEPPGFIDGLIELSKSRTMVAYSFVSAYVWFVDSFAYYGLSFYSTHLTSNRYLSYCLSGAVEGPAYVVTPILFSKLGRLKTCILLHAISGVCLLLILAVPSNSKYDAAVVALSLVGKFAIAGIFQGMYTYTVEFYPTTLRTTGVGIGFAASRAGGIIAPYVGLLADYNKRLPTALFGVLALVASCSSIVLPETKGKPLPDYVVDVEQSAFLKWFRGRKHRRVEEYKKF